MIEGAEIPFSALYAQAEEVAQPADVFRGVGFVQDAVLAKGLGGHAEGAVDPDMTDLGGSNCALCVDEQVRVDGLRPTGHSVVQPGSEASPDVWCQQHCPAWQVDPAIADIREQ